MARHAARRPLAPAPGLDDRLHLLAHNRQPGMILLTRALAEGHRVEDLVLVIADTRDAIGRAFAEAVAPRHGLDAAAEHDRVVARGDIPTAVLVLPVVAVTAASLADSSRLRPRAGSGQS